MAVPDLATDPPEEQDTEPAPETDEEPDEPDADPGVEADEAPETDENPNIEEVELTEDDMGGSSSDLFTSTDDAKDTADSDDSDDEEDDDGADLDGLGERGESMEQAINEGAARVGVLGLEGDERDDLESEFTEVFEAFRLGYFGSRFMEEYVFTSDDEEVDPAWGLFGSMLTCAAVMVWLRPDGDEIAETAREAVENIAGGDL